MALFPFAPLDVAVELYVNSAWTDVTTDVYARDKIRVSRGRQNEQSQPSPSTCDLTLDNRTGAYSTRNPLSPYYPSLGRNTPLRVAIRTAKDAYGRTISNGFGNADVGGAYSTAGGGGTVQASNWNVASGVGTMLLPVASAYRYAYLGGQLYHDVDVAVSSSVPTSNITGGSLNPLEIVLSWLSTSDYFYAAVTVSTAEVVSMTIAHADGTIIAGPTTVTGLAFTGQQLRARAQVDGQTIRGKVWAASGSEPYAWAVEGRSDKFAGRAAGAVGPSCSSGSGNTNVPITVSCDNLEVRVNRFAGEISAFPPQWDTSGKDVYTQIQASGIRRRLTQGKAPLKSTYLRGNQTISPAHLAYWPVEDASTATSIASGLPGGAPMLVQGSSQFASSTDFVGSAAIGKPNNSRWSGDVVGAAATGQIQAVFLLSIPSTGEGNDDTIFRINTSGTAAFWDLFYVTGGSAYLRAYDQARIGIYTSGTIGFGLDGTPVQVSIELTQNGANIDWTVATLKPGATTGTSSSGTVTGSYTISAVTGVMASPYMQMGPTAIGHIAARNSITSIYTLSDQLAAYNGETAGARVARLCTENGIASRYAWNADVASAQLGVQGRSALLDLLDEAANADQGSLHDSRSVLGVVQRYRSSLYNQSATLALNYATGQVVPPWRPIEDDQALRNDVVVSRTGGSSFEARQTTGRLAVTEPSTGTGVGRYDTSVTLNLYSDAQLQDAAGWTLNLGTVDEARYPTITANLAKLANISNQLWLDALGVNLDDRITVSNPKALISPDTISQIARGYTETFGGFEHEITYQCTPESPYEVVVLDSASMGKIDSETSTLAGAVTSGATTLYVTDTSGAGWTTAGGDMPIPITVGGEAMSVTAVANQTLSNVDFEAGLSPWTSGGASSFTQSSTQKHGGSFAARLVPTGSAARTYAASELIPVTVGQKVVVSGWMWTTNAVTSNASVGISWYDASQVNTAESHNFVSVTATTWTQLSNIFTVPAGAAYAQVVAVIGGTPAAGQIFYVDDTSLTGPQKFTVTRSINGVVKSQTSGTTVSLTRRAVIAL